MSDKHFLLEFDLIWWCCVYHWQLNDQVKHFSCFFLFRQIQKIVRLDVCIGNMCYLCVCVQCFNTVTFSDSSFSYLFCSIQNPLLIHCARWIKCLSVLTVNVCIILVVLNLKGSPLELTPKVYRVCCLSSDT